MEASEEREKRKRVEREERDRKERRKEGRREATDTEMESAEKSASKIRRNGG